MSVRAIQAGSVVEYFKQAMEIIKPNWLMLAVAVLVIAVISSVLTRISPLLGGIIAPLVNIPLSAGLYLLIRDSANRRPFDFAKLFSVFSNTPMLINLLIIAAPQAVLGLLQYLILQAGLWPALGLLFLVAIGYAILATFAVQRVIFGGLDGVSALKESAQGVLANIVPCIVFSVLALVTMFIGVLALLIGIFFAIPLIFATVMRMHDDIYGFVPAAQMPMAPPPPPPGAPGW